MDVTHPTHHFVQRTSFHILTPDQIRKLSVKLITESEIFDTLNHPIKGGLYDPSLGPVDKNGRCSTCGLGSFQCPGHFGHIELAVPVYAPLTFSQMFQLLKQTCLYCHHFRVGNLKTQVCLMKLQLLDAGYLIEAKELDNMVNQKESSTDSEGFQDVDSIIHRIRNHVHQLLATVKEQGYIRGRGQRNSSVADYRAKVIGEFLKRGSSTSNVCQHCKGYIPALYRHSGTKIFISPLRKSHQILMDAKGMDPEKTFKSSSARTDEEIMNDEEEEDEVKNEEAAKGLKFLTPMHVFEHLRILWRKEETLLRLMFGSQLNQKSITPTDHRIFFVEVLSVPPSRFRPPSVFGGSQFDHPQNSYLVDIIKLNKKIIEVRGEMKKSSIGDKALKIDSEKATSVSPLFPELIKTWISLQEQINYLFDSSKNTSVMGKIPPPGVKQILEKKEGLFRKHMMGKRVNFAARSVISPDPNLDTSEIGVPMVFARKLTYPEPVTDFNLAELREAVINGPEIHPGASHVQMEDGTLANLENMNKNARVALANQLRTPTSGDGVKKVMRHIRSGDIVLMNRQPTLHKPSIMAHKVRVLPGEKTLRMHYANCDTYNADFDGDEMNLHFPQSELARAEAYNIANTNNQYLVPTDGSPLRGLIQDHVVTGVLLTLKDTWLTRETYQQLLCGSLPENIAKIITIPPAIVRPQPLWSGKQVITTVLCNLSNGKAALNLSGNCKINAKMWGAGHAEEAQVNFIDGYMATGLIDKSQIGASDYGITHAIHELYGSDAAGLFLSILGKLLTKYDQFVGFTCRMDDLLLNQKANAQRVDLIASSHALGRKVVSDYAKVNDINDRQAIAESMERIIRLEELSRGLDGAMKVKMNELTSKIIESCLPEGQFKSFPINNMSLMTLSGAKGSMVNFSQIAGLLGQQELEGRRVPVMVSGKTLPSFPAFDPRPRAGGYITQRFLTGIRPQEFFFHCMAGREGLIDTAVKTSRSGYLQRCLIKHLESLKVHYDNTVRDSDGSVLQFFYGEDGLDVVKQTYLYKFGFIARNFNLVADHCQPSVALERVNTDAAVKALRKAAKKPSKYEPVITRFSPNVFLGATSERFNNELSKYLSSDEGKRHLKLINLDENQFKAVLWLKYMKSLIEPGEAVGLLAAQSVGEPSTQMTLNTFHFAGFGAKNVTLGIPRLREIIMTASQTIKTPSLNIPMKSDSKLTAEELAKRMSRLTLKQILSDIQVEERLVNSGDLQAAANLGRRARIYSITLHLLPVEECREQFHIAHQEIQDAIENSFIRILLSAIEKTLKRMKSSFSITKLQIKEEKVSSGKLNENDEESKPPKRDNQEESESSEDEEEDMDVEDAKSNLKRSNMTQQNEDLGSEFEDESEGMENSIEEEDSIVVVRSAKKESVLAQTRFIRNYQYDMGSNTIKMDMIYSASQPKLLLLDILERHVGDVVIRQIPGISRVFPVLDDPNHPAITTEGANILGFWDNPFSPQLDLNHLYSNDVHAILSCYGVEAARAVIVKEVAAVFAVYGISVDMRHLYLIADYMTSEGGYRPFNRMGMSSSSSPLLQMTFETTLSFLRQASLVGDFDDLNSPSARLVMGLPVALGTGMMQVRQPFDDRMIVDNKASI